MFIFVIVCFVYCCFVMVKTHADKIYEAMLELDVASPREIMDWVKSHYSDDPVNPSSYRADIIGCSINHSSSHHYPNSPKFLWFIEETKEYRLATENDDANIKEIEHPTITPVYTNTEIIDGVHVSELSPTCKLFIPEEIRKRLEIQSGDKIGFIVKDDGSVELKKARIKLSFE